MKNLFFVILVCLFSLPFQAQKFNVNYTEKTTEEGYNWLIKLSENEFLSVIRNNAEPLVTFRKYDVAGKLLAQNTYSFDSSDKESKCYLLSLAGKDAAFITILCSKVSTSDKSTNLYFLQVSKDLKSIQLSKSFNTFTLAEGEADGLRYSPDNSVLMHTVVRRLKKTEQLQYDFKFYDTKTGNFILDKHYTFDENLKNVSVLTEQVDNNKNIYLSATIEKGRKERVENFSDHYIRLLKIGDNNETKELNLDYEGKNINRVHVTLYNDSIRYFSFMNNVHTPLFKRRMKLVNDGFSYNTIDTNTFQVNKELVTELGELYPDLDTEDCIPYYFKHTFHRKNGGFVVVAEQYKKVIIPHYEKETRVVRSQGELKTVYAGQSTDRIFYYYCDIAVIFINKKNRIESVQRIPKYQENADNMSITCSFNQETETVHVIYEDELKNADRFDDDDIKTNRRGFFEKSHNNALYLASIKPKKMPKKELIVNYKDTEIRPKISNILWVNSNSCVLNGGDLLGVLNFEDASEPVRKKMP